MTRCTEHALGELGDRFEESGLPLVPIKGALRAMLGELHRGYADIDLLIPEAQHGSADRALRGLGYRQWVSGEITTSYLHPDRPLPVDVHRRCFPWGLFDLSAADVLARSTPLETPSGLSLQVLAPLDDYALVIGHLVKDRRGRRELPPPLELESIRRRGRLEPAATLDHLERVGMKRAGHFVHRALADVQGDPFARAAVALSSGFGTARVFERGAALWIESLPPRHRAAYPATHLLDVSSRRGARSFVRHTRESIASRWQRFST